jgi:SAM-dependent methyltransferase
VFTVAAESYDRFMGTYSSPLAPQLADFAGVASGARVLDVGCGPGALTTELVRRVGAAAVSAVEPSEQFAAAAAARHPGVDVRRAPAEHLPFADGEFDVTLAQLVVHFMSEPERGIAEMARVTRTGGVVAACVWDHAGGTGPISAFWQAAHELDADVADESLLAGAREGHLVELLEAAGLQDVEQAVLSVRVRHRSLDEWWEPFTLGVGPAGAYVDRLSGTDRSKLKELCRRRLPADLAVTARAWAARGVRAP